MKVTLCVQKMEKSYELLIKKVDLLIINRTQRNIFYNSGMQQDTRIINTPAQCIETSFLATLSRTSSGQAKFIRSNVFSLFV